MDPRSAAPAAAIRPATSGDFESRLALLLSQSTSGAFQAGRISIVGAERAQERFGTSWERLASRADRIARNAIERYLLPGDIYTVWRDMSYLIVFASLEPDRARMKCLLIADEVMKSLFGDEGSDVISVAGAVAPLVGGSGDAATLLDKLFATASDEAGSPSEDEVKLVPASARKSASEKFQFGYRPMWDTTLSVLSAYLCVPMLPGTDATAAFVDAGLAVGSDPEALAQLDFALQERVLADLSVMHSEHCRVLIVLCVHFETLAAAAQRRRYVEALARSVTAEAAKLLVIEIVDVPDGVHRHPTSSISRRRSGRIAVAVVSARLRVECATLNGGFSGARIHAVGCDIGVSQAPELTIMQQLARFSRAAEKAGLASFVHGLRSVSLSGAAVGAGFRYIDGEGVAKLVDRPERVTSFNLSDIYRPILGAERP